MLKKFLLLLLMIGMMSPVTLASFSFCLIDNFEGGVFEEGGKWWRFGDLKVEAVENQAGTNKDVIAESCGEYSLNISGQAQNWYVGGIGTYLGLDATLYSRFQIDVYGNDKLRGKLLIHLFDDDNNNYMVEQDADNNYEPTLDDQWVAEVNIQGEGFTRYSIPFSAFHDANPGIGDDIWNPVQKDGSGGLLQTQLIVISAEQAGKVELRVDNLLLTY